MYNYIIIDDNRIDLLVASKAIEISHKAVVEVHQFLSASIALEFVKNNATPFLTIMLIDIQMPLMNGFEFMEELNKTIYVCF